MEGTFIDVHVMEGTFIDVHVMEGTLLSHVHFLFPAPNFKFVDIFVRLGRRNLPFNAIAVIYVNARER